MLRYLALSILLFPVLIVHSQEQHPPDTTYIYHIDSLEYDLDEIVITGTRTSKKIIDIPYSVARINNMEYRYQRMIGIDDVLADVPGLFMQSRYGNHDVRISIRGFGSKSNSGIRGVRILLDDIPESEPDGQTRIEAIDFNSIGRIEIVKGNSSSLYTNAPGGVVNFINDLNFSRSFITQFNQIGSFGLRRNGIKAGLVANNYKLLATYSNHQFDGYREHNNENWHILNMVLETTPTKHSSLKILGYFVDGMITLPGSLTKEEFEKDPYQADQRAIDRDQKRISTKGRLGIRFTSDFGKNLNNQIEITGYGTIKYFERTSKEYRIINRYGIGLTARYTHESKIGRSRNEFSAGGDLLLQPARTEFYRNLSGTKDDLLYRLLGEKISNTGFYFSDNFEIIKEKMFVLLTGRYDEIVYDVRNEIAQYLTGRRSFGAFTPKVAVNYKFRPFLALYSSFGLGFESPAKNEMDSFDPSTLYNQDILPQRSTNFEIGFKGNLHHPGSDILQTSLFEITFFNIMVDNEIVPYEIYGDVFFRNAARTSRTGLEAGTKLEMFRNFRISLAYTYSGFHYQDYQAVTIDIDSIGNITETERDFSGNIVPSVPRHNFYTSASYSHPVGQKIDGFIKLSYRGVSGLWVDDANSDRTDAYHLVNSVVGADMRHGQWNFLVSVGINNIFDVVHVGFTNTNSADGRFYEAGEPRNYFSSVRIGYYF